MPLLPTSPVRPRPTVKESPSKTGVPSGHRNVRAEQVTAAGEEWEEAEEPEEAEEGEWAMVISQSQAQERGLRMRAPRGDRAGTGRGERGRPTGRDGSGTEVASARTTGGERASSTW
ncbi:hypothetical protein GCM10023324_21760 [Streptomyces youssoufiensis]